MFSGQFGLGFGGENYMFSGQFGLEFRGENLDVLGDWGCFCILRFGGHLFGSIKRARSKADFSPLLPIRFCTFYHFPKSSELLLHAKVN
jgi:hypothetical protein